MSSSVARGSDVSASSRSSGRDDDDDADDEDEDDDARTSLANVGARTSLARDIVGFIALLLLYVRLVELLLYYHRPSFSRAMARQPMSLRLKPPGHWMVSTAWYARAAASVMEAP